MKPILKNSFQYLEDSLPLTTSSTVSREDKYRETALYHANLLQHRKDVEASIFAFTEALLDLPHSATANPARPSDEDAAFVKKALQSFQPSDYDALLQERNINEQCGYVLCPRPNRHEASKAKYRILYGAGRSSDAVRFVESQTLERFCSDDCGKRALHLKVQLTKEPAWMRVTIANRDIMFLESGDASRRSVERESSLVEELSNLDLIEEEKGRTISKLKALALERGIKDFSDGSSHLIDSRSLEAQHAGARVASPPSSVLMRDEAAMPHSAIEGYLPKIGRTGGAA